MRKEKRPALVTDDHLRYLDELRASGDTNMWAAGLYLEEEFDIPKEDATEILVYWIKSYGERSHAC